MGDPKKPKKRYQGPLKKYDKARIEEEIELLKQYGLKNKTEVWKGSSLLRKFKTDAKKLIRTSHKQAEIERVHLLKKLRDLNLVSENAKLDDILSVSVQDVLNRRLQTVVFKLGLARSIDQSRQLITHRHIQVNDKIITSPSYLVSSKDEGKTTYSSYSSFTDDAHALRTSLQEPARKRPITSIRAKGRYGKSKTKKEKGITKERVRGK
jgi:small subunit ribosomal protein S4